MFDRETAVGLAIIIIVAVGVVYNIVTGGIFNFLLWGALAICILITQTFEPDVYGDKDGF